MTPAGNYQAKEHYRSTEVAQGYDQERFSTWYGRIAHETEEKALTRAVEKYFAAPGTVLDIPCWTGRLLPVFLRSGLEVTGGDISEAMLAVARAKFSAQPGMRFEKVDAENLSFPDNAFDYVTSYRLMCHLPPAVRDRVLEEMVRVSRKFLVINYHVEVYTPLYFFNRIFRPKTRIAFPLKEKDLRRELAQRRDVDVLEIRRLSWFERSSMLVVMQKRKR